MVSWVIYDLANTVFALGVVGLYLPDWMTRQGLPDTALAVTQAFAGAVVIVAAPWVGARTDHSGRRLPTLMFTTLVAVAATAWLAAGPTWLTFLLLGAAVAAVNIGSVVYDALLGDVSTPHTRGRVSGWGVGVGYLGSFLGVGIGWVTLDVAGWTHTATFRTLAAAFLLFSLPAFLWIEERPRPRPSGPPPRLGSVLVDLVRSWRRARSHPPVFRFLLGRLLYTDAINTLIGGFLAIYALEELGFDRRSSADLLAMAIGGAVLGGVGGGRLVTRFGASTVLRAALVMWIVAIGFGVAAAWLDVELLAWAIGPMGGFALGATWTSDRVMMVELSPPERLGEFYGLYATVGRFATVTGPLVWAAVVDLLGWGRPTALGTLGLLVAAGWWVIGTVERIATANGG
ncbi:MAG: MFS transporter [Acidimicrobiia bacterium]|nr:MAG: MFS transporter [Acidimicrobiia bacterium]